MLKEEHYRAAERLMHKAEQILGTSATEVSAERAKVYTLLAQTHLNAVALAPGQSPHTMSAV